MGREGESLEVNSELIERERGNTGAKRKLYQKVEVVADERSGQKQRDRKGEEER